MTCTRSKCNRLCFPGRSADVIFEWVYGWSDWRLEEACPPGSERRRGTRQPPSRWNISTNSHQKRTSLIRFAWSHIKVGKTRVCVRYFIQNSRALDVLLLVYKGFLLRRKCRGCSALQARYCLSSLRLYSSALAHYLRLPFFNNHLNLLLQSITDLCVRPEAWLKRKVRVLTSVAGARKHGCSAESPAEARRASKRSAPLEG